MAIYRGPGGAGAATNDTTRQYILATQAAFEAAQSAEAADNALDEFTDLYLGAKLTDPTVDNDGNTIQTGALYFNTVANEFRVWTGTHWQVIIIGAIGDSVILQSYSGDGVETEFTLSTEPFSENVVLVFINGTYQQKNTYSISGTTLTFSEAPPLGTDNIEVSIITMADLSNLTAGIVNLEDAADYYESNTVEGALQEVGRKLSGTISVKDFGAIGDGVTDDTAAIQAAEDYASINSLSVRFPAGTYLCGSAVYRKGNTDWIGDGMYLSVLKHSGGAATHNLIYVADLDTSYSHIGFYNLGFDGNRTGSTDPSAARTVVLMDRNAAGPVSAPAEDVRFIGCRVFNFTLGGHGFHIKGYTGVQVKDSMFEDGGDGLYHPLYVRRCADVSVTGNVSLANTTNVCIKVQSSPQAVIANNIVRDGARGIFVQDGDQTTVSGNTITDCDVGFSSTIELASSTVYTAVVGNVIKDCDTGVQLSSCVIGTISNNVIAEFTTKGITARSSLEFSINGNSLRTADSGGGAIDFINFEAGPVANRASVTGNLLRNGRPSGVTNGVTTDEVTTSNIFVANNNFSALSSWTAFYVGLNPALDVSTNSGLVVNYKGRISTASQTEIHGAADIAASPGFSAYNWRNADRAPAVSLHKSRSGTVGVLGSSVQNGDDLGTVNFFGDHNGSLLLGARILSNVDGVPTPSADDLPADLLLQTRPAGGSAPLTRIRIAASGAIIPALPTSPAGLPSGALWNDGNIVKVSP